MWDESGFDNLDDARADDVDDSVFDWSGPEPPDDDLVAAPEHREGRSDRVAYTPPGHTSARRRAIEARRRMAVTAAAIGSMTSLMVILGWNGSPQPVAAGGSAPTISDENRAVVPVLDPDQATARELATSVDVITDTRRAAGPESIDRWRGRVVREVEATLKTAERARWRSEVLTQAGLVDGGAASPAGRPALPARVARRRWERLLARGAEFDVTVNLADDPTPTPADP